MVKDFFKDLEKAKGAERIVAAALSHLGYSVLDVSNDRAYFYKGDLMITSSSGERKYVEVKDDSCIHRTNNILCEEEVFYKTDGVFGKGNMQSDYEIYSVVSREERKIYFLDFSKMKKIYKCYGNFKTINHYDQITYCYLLSLSSCRASGALLGVYEYGEEEEAAA